MALNTRYPWLILSLASLIFGVIISIGSVNCIGKPFPGFRYLPFEYVSLGTKSDWDGARLNIRPEDRILSIDNSRIKSIDELRQKVGARPVGTIYQYEIKRGDAIRSVQVRSEKFTALDFTTINLPWLIIGFLYVTLGAIAYVFRPGDDSAKAHLVWTALMAAFFFENCDVDSTKIFAFSFLPIFYLAGASTFHFAMVFPTPFNIFVRHRKIQAIPYLITLPFAVVALWLYSSSISSYGLRDNDWFVFANNAGMVFSAFSILVLIGSIGIKTFQARTDRQFRQGQLVLYGMALAFLPMIMMFVLPFLLGVRDSDGFWLNITTIAFIIVPASIALAIVRYNLFDITLVIKRTLTYAVTLTFVFSAYFLLTATLHIFWQWALGADNTLLSQCIGTGVTALLFAPVRDRTFTILNKVFDRSTYDYRQVVSEFTRATSQSVDAEHIADAFADAIDEALHPHGIAIVLTESMGRATTLLSRGVDQDNATEILTGLPEEGYRTFPLTVAEKHIGQILLGPRKSDQRYTEEDLHLVESLARGLGLAVSYAGLFHQLAGQERLKRELEIATDVQMGLLPKQIPQMHGVLLSAFSIPALEVGGDFYDFVQIDAYRWGILVGDVSGKGVPAALMMAVALSNFRAVAPGIPSPASTLTRLNKLIHRNRPSNKVFVAAMYAIYDARDGSVLIANAGLPKPLLNGVEVQARGFPLGALAKTTYRDTRVELDPLSSLVLYTDGLEDVESEFGELFGPDRVRKICLKMLDAAPDMLRMALEQHLKTFTGNMAYADDVTVVALQRLANVEPLTVVTPARAISMQQPQPSTSPLSPAGSALTRPLEERNT